MSRALLLVSRFWNPVCVPICISSLKAYAEQHGHQVEVVDLNADSVIFGCQHLYFKAIKRQFPRWKNWNIERNGTEMLALYQVVWLKSRENANYRQLTAEFLNTLDDSLDRVYVRLDLRAFDDLFEKLYIRVGRVSSSHLFRIQPDIVGVSLFNSTWPGTLFLTELTKRLLPNARTVVCGPGPVVGITADPEEIRTLWEANASIDFFVLGEGEERLLETMGHPRRPNAILSAQVGREARRDLDELPDPDYGTMDVERYLQLSVASSRGCPFECSFCAETVFWQGYRSLRKGGVYDRIERLAQRHGMNSFYLCDSLSNATIGPLTRKIRENGRPYLLDCYLRVDKSCIDPAKAADWRAGGPYRPRLGMESASQSKLDAMVKMTTPDLVAQSLRALPTNGITTSTLWIVGYPGDTQNDIQSTLDFMYENKVDINQQDALLFEYHSNVLSDSEGVADGHTVKPKFGDSLPDLLLLKTFFVSSDPNLQERFNRLERSVDVMKQCQIPNPNSLVEWMGAERRCKEFGRDAGWNLERSMMLNA